MNFDKGLIGKHLFSLFTFSVIVAMSFVFYAFWDLRNSKEEVIHEVARTFTGVINSSHKLYTKQIVAAAQRNGMSLSVDYKKVKNSLPWPQTFARELGETMSEIHPNTSMATYSRDPHASSKNRILDSFQEQALSKLENGGSLFYKIYDSDDGKYVRYAKPILMIQPCADCHNNPEIGFSKHDWKRGDFAGVREVKFPFPKSLVKVENTITNIAIVLASAVFFGLFFVSPMLRKQRAENNSLFAQTKILQAEANTDPLTGLFNRRYLEDMLDPYIREFTNEGLKIGIMALDIDHFKPINDTYGHDVGDEVLIKISNCLKNCSREHDIIARIGGEEFIVVIPVSGDVQAENLANRYRRTIENMKVKGADYTINPTASFGVATSVESMDGAELMKLADGRLYEAKRTGRNKVVSGDQANEKDGSNVVDLQVV